MQVVLVGAIEVVIFFFCPFADDFSWNTTNDGKWFYVVSNYSAGSDHSPLTNGDAGKNDRIAAYPCSSSNGYGCSLSAEVDVVVVMV